MSQTLTYMHGDKVPTSTVHVTVDTSVLSIPNYAFYGCTALVTVVLHAKLRSIGWYAFSNCTALTDIKLPDGLLTIGTRAFSNCSSLPLVDIPSSVISIHRAFEDCTALVKVVLHKGLQTIGERTFFNCSALKEVDLPDGLYTIGERAFSDCSALVKVKIPNDLGTIEKSAFSNCTVLVDIKLPNDLIKIGEAAFSKCCSLPRIIIPSSVIAIENNAFTSCTALADVVLHEGLLSIGRGTFSHCALLCVKIPTTTTSIGENAFHCELLRNVAISQSTSTLVTQDVFANSFPYLHYKGITLDTLKRRFDEQSFIGYCHMSAGDPQTVKNYPAQNVNCRDCLGMTPLHVLLCSGIDYDFRFIELIIKNCPNELLLAKDMWGEVPLVYALLGNSSLKVINYLFEMHSKIGQSLPFDFGHMIAERLVMRPNKSAQFMRDIIRVQRTHFPDIVVDWQQIVDNCISKCNHRLFTIGIFTVLVEASVSTRGDNCMSKDHRDEVNARICVIEEGNDYIKYINGYLDSNKQRVIVYYTEIKDKVIRYVQLHNPEFHVD